MATAPDAIFEVFGKVQQYLNRAELAGIVGDSRHSFGYHLARIELPPDDYSVVLPLDQTGDPGAASAIDISFDPQLMIAVTSRLLAAAKANDPRMKGVREFCGTTDGVTTHPYDLSNGQDGPLGSWDSSHLSHVHISFYRAYANDFSVIGGVADVITSQPYEAPAAVHATPLPEDEDDMKRIALIRCQHVVYISDLMWVRKVGDDRTTADRVRIADMQRTIKARGGDDTIYDVGLPSLFGKLI